MPGLPKIIAAACVALAAGVQLVWAEELGPTLRKAQELGEITAGYRDAAPPLSYTGADGQPIGFALDLCALVANKIKETLRLTDLKVAYQPLTATTSAALLENGAVALDCGATPVTPDLQKHVAFSNPVFVSEITWLVPRRLRVEREGRRRPRVETISPSVADDLRNKTVALTHGSAATAVALTVSNDRSLGLSIIEGKDNAEAFKLLESGKVSAVLGDDVQLAAAKADAKNPDAFGFIDSGYPGTSYVLMLRKDDKRFKDLVDQVLADAIASGEYARLYTKWFDGPIPPKNVNLAYPMPERLKETLKVTADKPASQ